MKIYHVRTPSNCSLQIWKLSEFSETDEHWNLEITLTKDDLEDREIQQTLQAMTGMGSFWGCNAKLPDTEEVRHYLQIIRNRLVALNTERQFFAERELLLATIVSLYEYELNRGVTPEDCFLSFHDYEVFRSLPSGLPWQALKLWVHRVESLEPGTIVVA